MAMWIKILVYSVPFSCFFVKMEAHYLFLIEKMAVGCLIDLEHPYQEF